MFSLIKFEFKKLAKKRRNIITLLVSVIITIMCFSMPAMTFKYSDTKGVDYKGLKAIALKRENIKKHSIKMTEEQVAKDIKEYQGLFSKPENTLKDDKGEPYLKNDVYLSHVEPKSDYFYLICRNYNMHNNMYGLSSLLSINLQEGARFYETRTKKISTRLNKNYEGGNYSEQEKTFWLNKNSKIQKPYTYGYHEGWSSLIRIFESMIFALLAICIIIAPVFAGEYQCGADAIILSSKYGKNKLITAKIISAFAFASMVFFLNVIFAVAVPLLFFGIEGWNLPMQIYRLTTPYDLTFASGTLIYIGISYLVMLGTVSFTMLLSAKFKTAFTVLVIDIIILFLPMFMDAMSMGEGADNGLYNHILYLLPYPALMPSFDSYLSYSFGGITISLLLMRIIVYAGFTIILLPFIRNAFRKHQVK